jgi:hypothetical protein
MLFNPRFNNRYHHFPLSSQENIDTNLSKQFTVPGATTPPLVPLSLDNGDVWTNDNQMTSG